jgi:hypothetical protein
VTHDELVEAVADALYLSDDLEKIPPGTDWEHVVAAAAVDVVIPMVTEAIGDAIRDVAFEVFVASDGERSIKVDLHHEGLTKAEKIARAWQPGPKPPMRVMERIYDDE